jgi:hypothetical protein
MFNDMCTTESPMDVELLGQQLADWILNREEANKYSCIQIQYMEQKQLFCCACLYVELPD